MQHVFNTHCSGLEVPVSARRRTRVDPRLFVGILLVVLAVAGVVGVVQAAARTTRVYAAATALASGDTISDDKLRAVEVSAAMSTDLYLTRLDGSPRIATRPIGAGELVPLSALGMADPGRAAVVVPISGVLPADIGPGTDVEVWAAEPGQRPGTFTAPRVLVTNAHVVRVIESDGLVASDSVNVEVRVARTDLPAVFGATANGSRLQLVPTVQPVGR